MTLRRGEIKDFDPQTYTATVRLAGSLAVWLSGVAVARNIGGGEVQAGRNCAVVFFDDANPRDAVIVAVYD